jgi:8-oxo-dGTP pyrophosphatase MutT (NUDIX family)
MRELLAAGFVVAQVRDGQPRFLLLRSARHSTWLPPKGHVDADETLLEAARRETLEEAGISDMRVVEHWEREVRYEVDGRSKSVTYFLAIVESDTHTLSDEHDQSGWFTLDEVLARVAFEGVRQVFRDAASELASQS